MKTCSKCGVEKNENDFYKRVKSKDHLTARCKLCFGAYQRDPEKDAKRNKEWRQENPEAASASDRRSKLKSSYGISEDEYVNLFESQGGLCAICRNPHRGTGKYLHVDHNHLTEDVRGLLCGYCNSTLAYARDSEENLLAALNYLRLHRPVIDKFSLHSEALAWLRFGRKMPWVVTEVGPFNADVLGADDKQLIEIEIKKSRADFRNDFVKKTRKHEIYGNPPTGKGLWVPNLFYYLVPSKLKEAGIEILADNKSPAGLLVLESPMTERNIAWYGDRLHIRVVKQAQSIHGQAPSSGIIRKMGLRMSSALTVLGLKLENNNVGPNEIKSLVNTPDWEKEDETCIQFSEGGRGADPSKDNLNGGANPSGVSGAEKTAVPIPPSYC